MALSSQHVNKEGDANVPILTQRCLDDTTIGPPGGRGKFQGPSRLMNGRVDNLSIGLKLFGMARSCCQFVASCILTAVSCHSRQSQRVQRYDIRRSFIDPKQIGYSAKRRVGQRMIPALPPWLVEAAIAEYALPMLVCLSLVCEMASFRLCLYPLGTRRRTMMFRHGRRRRTCARSASCSSRPFVTSSYGHSCQVGYGSIIVIR